ncbi:MAG TPA: ribose-phosphate diphosphokinase [Acidimicrobiales bacterium]|nr:ribose-phosphate diphosphokinase [Acidimicrobiales bacterium]
MYLVELLSTHRLQLYAGRSHPELVEKIASHLGVAVGQCEIVDFPNGEIRARYAESVRGADVFILQTHCQVDGMSVNDLLMEQWVMIDAAKRGSAKRITAVCPRYGYGRQDRKSRSREPITARMVADFFHSAGAERIMSVDLHSGQVQGFFDGPVDHLTAVNLLTDYLRANLQGDFVMVSPDTGRTKVAEKAARNAGDVDMASVYKRRSVDRVGHVEALDVMGDVKGRMCVLIDDEIDTAGTLCEAAKILYQKGATEVWATATHGVFSDPAIDRLKNSAISRVIVTDTVPLPSEKQIPKIESVSVAETFADAIRAVFEEGSVSELFGGENQS